MTTSVSDNALTRPVTVSERACTVSGPERSGGTRVSCA
ncbi:MAG: hypothetical protein JWQ68_2186 [Cryobacterium sp.]|jgi:hypothetical protein|nr:hypothetical protein [Cryobacterium sp.]